MALNPLIFSRKIINIFYEYKNTDDYIRSNRGEQPKENKEVIKDFLNLIENTIKREVRE